MKDLKSIVYAFLIGGLFALVSQTVTTFWGYALGEELELYVPCLTLITMAVMFNQTNIYYDPEIIMNRVTPVSVIFYAAYAVFLLLPMGLQIAGELKY